ncbi:MAG: PEP-CTERM sorting domain-containing protein [Sandarakinorhabdus sp.]|nr:PEP-CTERM sorting domain-containing protein [Sandarakinorhabdus sp.]
MFKPIIRAAVVVTGLSLAASVQAAPLLFTLEGSRSAVFQLDSNPIPNSFTTLQTNFNNVAGTFGGVDSVASLINFGRSDGIFSAAALNILAPNIGFTQFSGPEIFTGTTADPIFSVGVFNLNNPFFGGPATLTITAISGGGGGMGTAVPEPASWALLITGFGMIGIFARRRNQSALAA